VKDQMMEQNATSNTIIQYFKIRQAPDLTHLI